MAVVVTIAKGYDLSYIWKTQDHTAGRTTGGYYIDAAQAGEPPGRWWGPGAQALGLAAGQTVERQPYDALLSTCRPGPGAPAPATTAPESTAASRAGSSPPG